MAPQISLQGHLLVRSALSAEILLCKDSQLVACIPPQLLAGTAAGAHKMAFAHALGCLQAQDDAIQIQHFQNKDMD